MRPRGSRGTSGRLSNARAFGVAEELMATMIVILVIGMVVDAVFGYVDGTLRRRRGLTSY